jgi:hypothetical protein
MPAETVPGLNLRELFGERDARRRHEQELEQQLRQTKDEQQREFRRRLEEFEVTEQHRAAILNKIRRAVDSGETEIMFASFPASFCSDMGRAINNVGVPPINPPDPTQQSEERLPEWVTTLPAGFRRVYELWKEHMKPGGFGFGARIISYPDGKPGEVGLFFTWKDPGHSA